MIKITNTNICETLTRNFGGTWYYTFECNKGEFHPKFVGIKENDGTTKNNSTELHIDINWKSEPSNEKLKEFFDKVNWAKIYNLTYPTHVKENGEWEPRKGYTHWARNFSFSFIVPKTIQEAVVSTLLKSKSGRKIIENKQH